MIQNSRFYPWSKTPDSTHDLNISDSTPDSKLRILPTIRNFRFYPWSEHIGFYPWFETPDFTHNLNITDSTPDPNILDSTNDPKLQILFIIRTFWILPMIHYFGLYPWSKTSVSTHDLKICILPMNQKFGFYPWSETLDCPHNPNITDSTYDLKLRIISMIRTYRILPMIRNSRFYS